MCNRLVQKGGEKEKLNEGNNILLDVSEEAIQQLVEAEAPSPTAPVVQVRKTKKKRRL